MRRKVWVVMRLEADWHGNSYAKSVDVYQNKEEARVRYCQLCVSDIAYRMRTQNASMKAHKALDTFIGEPSKDTLQALIDALSTNKKLADLVERITLLNLEDGETVTKMSHVDFDDDES